MDDLSTVTLKRPSETLKKAFLVWLKEAHNEGTYLFWSMQQVGEDFGKFTKDQLEKEIMCPVAQVPESVYWAIQDGQMVGRVSVRHYLNEKLKKRGGHIGYQVSTSYRGKGLAKQILRLSLREAKRLGLSEVLLTTDKSNLASQKVIKANNGLLDGSLSTEAHLYYWISLTK